MAKDTDIQIIPQTFDFSNISNIKLLEVLLLAQMNNLIFINFKL